MKFFWGGTPISAPQITVSPKMSTPEPPMTPLFYCRILFYSKNGDVCKKLERQCRIRLVVHFLFLETSFKIFGYVSEMIFFLGAVTYGAQEQFHFWGQKISRYPRLKSFLGAVTYGAQEEIFLCEKSKVFERCFKK